MRVLALLAVLLLLPSAAQAAFRCGTGLVDVGDWPVEVKERCGEPDYVAIYPEAALPGIGIVQTVEHWYYNPGPSSFIRRLVFRNGRLQSQDSLGYGFLPGAAGNCNPRVLNDGMSEFEVIKRCGEPLSKRITWVVPDEYSRYAERRGVLQGIYPVEEWMYEFGSNQFRRIVTFRDGRITEVESAGKPQ
ncbi:hypothetical protein RE428_39300 [Marinobacter nanhaiticus D15-8W]|uniref:DUF2845 domain-containing protein n=1 Tax=Marinobacter nanhaiticus D15-8W TaxID=626887 RepID=N6X5A2_9GAMM|nr:DUF2845 domain-containing protein [Marinobacter nanhaiticus]ENO16233.1 DUF2845 domain-containing protein [Marinobacter nanhaiticus D15-8W]BES72912.1 hypothetical protein RE428_39300 [Marinobacter nanhaiticus D15-8W]